MMPDIIDFRLDNAGSGAQQAYRPWGTRTLKVKVSSGQATPALRVRPRGVRPDEMERGLFQAYCDDSDAFVVSWGGGHEPGPCIESEDFLMAFERCASLTAGASSMLFFNLTHVGPDLPDTAALTLEAYDEESDVVFAAVTVQIMKPELPLSVVRFEQSQAEHWRPVGDHLADYDPRWWPRPVTYKPTGPLPLLVAREGLELSVSWDNKVVATVSDFTEPTILDTDGFSFELFGFDEWHVALRIWFFWLDKNLGTDFFVGRHEVPDAERFDLLIDKRDGRVSLACTDLHWRETWGQVEEDKLLRATLGLNLETKLELAKDGLDKLWSAWKREEKKDHTRPYNPIEYIERLAERLAKDQTGTVRAKGTEAHLPSLHNVTQLDDGSRPPRMTSSDVRLG